MTTKSDGTIVLDAIDDATGGDGTLDDDLVVALTEVIVALAAHIAALRAERLARRQQTDADRLLRLPCASRLIH